MRNQAPVVETFLHVGLTHLARAIEATSGVRLVAGGAELLVLTHRAALAAMST